jgi:hypothetical protein
MGQNHLIVSAIRIGGAPIRTVWVQGRDGVLEADAVEDGIEVWRWKGEFHYFYRRKSLGRYMLAISEFLTITQDLKKAPAARGCHEVLAAIAGKRYKLLLRKRRQPGSLRPPAGHRLRCGRYGLLRN